MGMQTPMYPESKLCLFRIFLYIYISAEEKQIVTSNFKSYFNVVLQDLARHIEKQVLFYQLSLLSHYC